MPNDSTDKPLRGPLQNPSNAKAPPPSAKDTAAVTGKAASVKAPMVTPPLTKSSPDNVKAAPGSVVGPTASPGKETSVKASGSPVTSASVSDATVAKKTVGVPKSTANPVVKAPVAKTLVANAPANTPVETFPIGTKPVQAPKVPVVGLPKPTISPVGGPTKPAPQGVALTVGKPVVTTTAALQVAGLQPGLYVFSLTVTDDIGVVSQPVEAKVLVSKG